jgi:HK97 family phage major capsid protein
MAKMTTEELKAMVTDAAKAAVTEAMKPKPTDPPAPPAQEPAKDGEGNTKSTEPPAIETKGFQPGEMQRKYSNVYMNIGAQPGAAETKQDKGIGWARSVKCVSMGNGDPERALQVAQKMYADDTILHRELKALAATGPSGGGYLIPEMYSADVIELLYAKAIVTQLGAMIVPMGGGTLTMPKLTSGATASYIGELRAPKGSKPAFGNMRLTAKKLATKVIISNDLLRSQSYKADQIIRDDALRAMALAMDKAALIGKGSEYEPLGLLNMPGLTKLEIGAQPDTSTTGSMLAKLIQANVDTNKLGWALNGFAWGAFYNVVDATGRYVYRDGMDKGQLNGHAFAVSNQLPVAADANAKTSVILGNWNDFVIGEQVQMEAELFREGSAKDETGEMISAIDNDASILRIISLHDFGVRHEQSFVVGTNLFTKEST